MKLRYQIHYLLLIVLVPLCYTAAAAPKKKQPQKKQEKKQEAKKQEPKAEGVKKETPGKQTEKKQAEGQETRTKFSDACNCVYLKIQANDTISEDAYITYIFTVKNRCKEPVWVSSTKFGFVCNNFNGSRARQIRELQFVKRFTYPPFVLIKPGGDFDFKFADNPFDEYQLKRGNRYWFRFTFNNMGLRHPSGKNLNYLCRKEMQRMVYIR